MPIQIENLELTPNYIEEDKGPVLISFDIHTARGTPVDIFYQFNYENNVYFNDDGTLEKELSQRTTVDSSVQNITSEVEIELYGSNEYDEVYLYVQVENTLNHQSDIKFATLEIR